MTQTHPHPASSIHSLELAPSRSELPPPRAPSANASDPRHIMNPEQVFVFVPETGLSSEHRSLTFGRRSRRWS